MHLSGTELCLCSSFNSYGGEPAHVYCAQAQRSSHFSASRNDCDERDGRCVTRTMFELCLVMRLLSIIRLSIGSREPFSPHHSIEQCCNCSPTNWCELGFKHSCQMWALCRYSVYVYLYSDFHDLFLRLKLFNLNINFFLTTYVIR